jgi:hypothetical protein
VESDGAAGDGIDPDEEGEPSGWTEYAPIDGEWETGLEAERDDSESWDDDEHEDEQEPPVAALPSDSVEREIALVALEAAALSRRIFPPAAHRRELSSGGRQVLLAISLVDSHTGLSAPELAHVLAGDREGTLEALAELVALGLVVDTERWDSDDDHLDKASYGLTARGREAALRIAEVAKRFLPGWPPPHP